MIWECGQLYRKNHGFDPNIHPPMGFSDSSLSSSSGLSELPRSERPGLFSDPRTRLQSAEQRTLSAPGYYCPSVSDLPWQEWSDWYLIRKPASIRKKHTVDALNFSTPVQSLTSKLLYLELRKHTIHFSSSQSVILVGCVYQWDTKSDGTGAGEGQANRKIKTNELQTMTEAFNWRKISLPVCPLIFYIELDLCAYLWKYPRGYCQICTQTYVFYLPLYDKPIQQWVEQSLKWGI